jgi:two-component system OmpR family response regulator
MRILVVEDEPTLAAQLVEGIQSVGYVVDVAHNGVDGHFMGETEPYDAIRRAE